MSQDPLSLARTFLTIYLNQQLLFFCPNFLAILQFVRRFKYLSHKSHFKTVNQLRNPLQNISCERFTNVVLWPPTNYTLPLLKYCRSFDTLHHQNRPLYATTISWLISISLSGIFLYWFRAKPFFPPHKKVKRVHNVRYVAMSTNNIGLKSMCAQGYFRITSGSLIQCPPFPAAAAADVLFNYFITRANAHDNSSNFPPFKICFIDCLNFTHSRASQGQTPKKTLCFHHSSCYNFTMFHGKNCLSYVNFVLPLYFVLWIVVDFTVK